MNIGKTLLSLLLLVGTAIATQAESEPRELMHTVEQWIELRDTLHRERVEWDATRTSLEQGIELLNRERDLLETRIAEHAAEADEATDQELALEQRRSAQDNALRNATAQLKSSDAALSDQLSAIFATALDTQREHQSIRVEQQLLDTPDDTQRLMDVLYLGHAQAYAVCRNDQNAAHGVWDGHEWTWNWDARHAPAIREAIRVRQGELAPRWTRLPVVILPEEATP